MRIQTRDSKTAAFTMVEIAIALGVIAFALVAIVGILPSGLNVERENREESLVNQDGPYFMEAIRSGAKGLDNLTNFVDSITITEITNNNVTNITVYNFDPGVLKTVGGTNFNGNMTNGEWIVGLLSRPKYWPENAPTVTNRIDAHVRALSGTAIEQSTTARDMSFNYSIFSELVPINFHSFQGNTNINPPFSANSTNTTLQANLHELRLNYRWPLYLSGEAGNGRKIYRSYVSGQVTSTNSPDGGTTVLYYLRPENFTVIK